MNPRSKKIDTWLRRNRGMWICDCGCGTDIEVKREHYKSGVPRFIKGHNFASFNPKEGKEAPPPETFWDRLSDEDKQRRMSQLKSFPRGEEHPNWSGGRILSDAGYVLIRFTEHPSNKDGYMAEHRLVVEDWLQRNDPTNKFMVVVDGIPYLNRTCVVHHRDENKQNNQIENLVLMKSQSIHLGWHMSDITEPEKFVKYSNDIFVPWLK